jgi:hypothetical protein
MNTAYSPEVGAHVRFGDIEWRLLDTNNQQALLLAYDIVEFRAFNETDQESNWTTCTLRRYLNGIFIERHFLPHEAEAIVETDLTIPENPQKSLMLGMVESILKGSSIAKPESPYGKVLGANTSFLWKLKTNDARAESFGQISVDRIFLLPYQTAQSYYENRLITKYVDSNSEWWLSTPGSIDGFVMVAGKWSPGLVPEGHSSIDGSIGLRPALCVDLLKCSLNPA